MSALAEQKYNDEPRLPTFEEALTEERLLKERLQLMEATKQLARLQMEMEAKVRAEIEAKIRAEMEAKMAGEVARMEEERKAQEERRALEAMKTERREKVLAGLRKFSSSSPASTYIASLGRVAIEFVESHKVMFYNRYSLKVYSTTDRRHISSSVYLSEKNVGIHIIFTDEHGGSTYQEIRPFYWFDSELTRRDLTIWDNMEDYNKNRFIHPFTQKPVSAHCVTLPFLCSYIEWTYVKLHEVNNHDGTSHSLVLSDGIDKFQTILRLIPGGYKNGPWRPLDGFFGPYLNEETLEIISLVPEMK